MSTIFNIRYAWRLLTKSWGHSLLSAVVVALSVGLALWTYLLVYSQALKPLGFEGSEHWYSIQIATDATAVARPTVDAFTYQELRSRVRSANHLGALAPRAAVLSEGEASTSLRGAAISPRLLSATQVPPLMGRVFDETDGQPGATPVAVISFDAWKNYFAGDPGIVGRQTRIDSQPVQVVGVMPKAFLFLQDSEVWLPLQLTNLAKPTDSQLTMFPLILVDEDQSIEAIAQEMKVVVDEVNKVYPELFNAGRKIQLVPALRMFTQPQVQVMAILSFMALAILLLGCLNISMIFLARLLERSCELALRTALGASWGRLLRQCLLETGLVVLLGLVLGYMLAAGGVGWASGIAEFATRIGASGRLPNMLELRPIDVLAAIFAAALVWVLSTILPARRIHRQDAAMVLAGSGKGAGVRGSSRGAAVLVGLQVIISSLVLVICGNLVFAIIKETAKPSGLLTERVVMSTSATSFDDRYANPSERLRYWDELAASISSKLPGATVAFASASPTRPTVVPVALETVEGGDRRGQQTLPLSVVSEDYFSMLALKVRAGRFFDSTDNDTSLNVAVIDERAAQRYWPGQEVLGKRVQMDPTGNGPWLTIVGVASQVAGRPYTRDIGVIYRPLRQAVPPAFQVLVKLPKATDASRDAIRAAAFAVDRDLPLHNLQALNDYLAAANIVFTLLVPIFVVVGSITAILAATGLFGLISRSVAQRTHEVGLRRALGADNVRAISMFIRQGAIYLGVCIVGVGLGLLITNVLSSVITNILDNVLLVAISVLLLMTLVVATATYLPTRRAIALEPGDALRYE